MKKLLFRTLIICIAITLFVVQCNYWINYRTPSHVRFSKACDIKLPRNIKVIKDKYHDLWQDFYIEYEVKLSKESQEKLIESIKQSKFYNPNRLINDRINREMIGDIDKDMFLEIDGLRAVWVETENGYKFQTDSGRHSYSAFVDTVSGIAKFEEFCD